MLHFSAVTVSNVKLVLRLVIIVACCYLLVEGSTPFHILWTLRCFLYKTLFLGCHAGLSSDRERMLVSGDRYRDVWGFVSHSPTLCFGWVVLTDLV